MAVRSDRVEGADVGQPNGPKIASSVKKTTTIRPSVTLRLAVTARQKPRLPPLTTSSSPDSAAA
jgi:hypothetical protein